MPAPGTPPESPNRPLGYCHPRRNARPCGAAADRRSYSLFAAIPTVAFSYQPPLRTGDHGHAAIGCATARVGNTALDKKVPPLFTHMGLPATPFALLPVPSR